MGYRGALKMWWMLISLLPLVFIAQVDGGHKKMTLADPYNATQEINSNNTLDYGMNYYDFPADLFLNDTHNDTYGLGLGRYYIGYFPDYYGYYEYPELDAYYDQVDESSTENIIPTPKPTKKHAKGTENSKYKRLRRKTRSVPDANVMKHLCMRNLINVKNIFQKVPYIYDCKDKEVKQFACLNSGGFIKPCFVLKEEKQQQVPLCIKKESAFNVVTTCNSSESQYFCFTLQQEVNRLVICNEHRLRVCFNGNLTNCENPEEKQVLPFTISPKEKNHEKKQLSSPVTIHLKHKKHEKKRVPRDIVKPSKRKGKPDVNCNNCEVDVKVEFDEMANNKPKVLIKVSKLDQLDKLMDDLDSDFDQ